MIPISSVQNAVAEYLGEKADFRESKEDEPWGGEKNASYAESIRRVAAYVRKLPQTDPTLRKLAACEALFFEGLFDAPKNSFGQSQTEADAIHCGPRGKVIEESECHEWFASWAEIAINEARQVQEGADDDGDEDE
jgi:hypothetical protein